MWHPDRNAHTVELARRKFEEIKIALDILSDEALRNQYDLKQFKSVHGCRRASRARLPRAGARATHAGAPPAGQALQHRHGIALL